MAKRERGKRRDGRTPSEVALRLSFVMPEKATLARLNFPEDAGEVFLHLGSAWKYLLPKEWPGCWVTLARLCNRMMWRGRVEHEWQRKMVSILTETPEEKVKMNQDGIRVKIEKSDSYN